MVAGDEKRPHVVVGNVGAMDGFDVGKADGTTEGIIVGEVGL